MPASWLVKNALNNFGSRIPTPYFERFETALNYLHLGRWARDHHFAAVHLVKEREDLISRVASLICDEEVLYLEFGVWQGASIRQWSSLLTNRASRLHGFDSFEGLPEDWDHFAGCVDKKGNYSTQGSAPQIPDNRVKFFKGWFQDTLPKYEFIDSPKLVIFIDADLYSSTAFVLKTLSPHIKVGAIVYFDDFWDFRHELKAFEEFLMETGMIFELLATTYGMRHAAFRRIK